MIHSNKEGKYKFYLDLLFNKYEKGRGEGKTVQGEEAKERRKGKGKKKGQRERKRDKAGGERKGD